MATTAPELTTSSSLVDASPKVEATELHHGGLIVSSLPLVDESPKVAATELHHEAMIVSSSPLVDESPKVAATELHHEAMIVSSSPLVDESPKVAATESNHGAMIVSSSPLVIEPKIVAPTELNPGAMIVSSSPLVDESTIVVTAELHHRAVIESEVEESGVSEERLRIGDNDQGSREEDEQAMSKSGKRRRQHVSTKRAQKKVILWMIKEVETSNTHKNIVSKAVKEFPLEFRSQGKANLQKASRWWKQREEFLELLGKTSEAFSLSAKEKGTNNKQVRTKALNGRGRKREAWVEWLHNELIDEFVRLKKASVKLSSGLLLTFAKDILEKSEHPDYNRNSLAKDGVKLVLKLTPRWIQCFQERFDISLRR